MLSKIRSENHTRIYVAIAWDIIYDTLHGGSNNFNYIAK